MREIKTYEEAALAIINLIDYDIYKECLEAIEEDGGCSEVYELADFLRFIKNKDLK